MNDGKITEENINDLNGLQVSPDSQPQETTPTPEVPAQPQAPIIQPVPQPAQPGTEAVQAKIAELDAAIARVNQMQSVLEAKTKELQASAGDFFKSKATQTDQQFYDQKIKDTKVYLDAQPKVMIYIPLSGNEKKGVTHPVTINGYRLNIPKGTYVNVPQDVAEQVKNSFEQTVAAEQDNPFNLANADDAKKNALTL